MPVSPHGCYKIVSGASALIGCGLAADNGGSLGVPGRGVRTCGLRALHSGFDLPKRHCEPCVSR